MYVCRSYVDIECLKVKTNGCKVYLESSFTTKIAEHVLSGFSMSTMSSFKSTKNKHHAYRGKDFMKYFCASLREHAMEINNKLLSY